MVGLFRVLGSGGGEGSLLKMSMVWVGHFAAVRGVSSVFSVGVDCRSRRCGAGWPWPLVVSGLFFVLYGWDAALGAV